MKYRNLESSYLISLLSSIFSQRTPPSPARAIDWRELFYLAEYHDITNISCYALIGLYDEIPTNWKDRFNTVFRKRVTVSGAQEKEAKNVLDALENAHIDYILLRTWQMREFYPQLDMRVTDDLELLIRPEQELSAKNVMEHMEYYYGGGDDYGSMIYYKSENLHIIFKQKLFAGNHKLQPYYGKIWKQARLSEGSISRYVLSIDDFYLYLLASVCDAFAREEADARDIIDIHLYLKHYKAFLNRTYIDTVLGQLELNKLVKYLEELSDLWFGVYEGEEPRICKDIEEYIWSKGAYGHDTAVKLLPMIMDMEIWRIKDARRLRIRRKLQWLFPKADYMKSSFPIVEKLKILLPVCWILRLLRMGYFSARIRVIGVYRIVALKFHNRFGNKEEDLNEDNTNTIAGKGKENGTVESKAAEDIKSEIEKHQ